MKQLVNPQRRGRTSSKGHSRGKGRWKEEEGRKEGRKEGREITSYRVQHRGFRSC